MIPAGLPALVTIVLAIGTTLMARQHAIVRQLPCMEVRGEEGRGGGGRCKIRGPAGTGNSRSPIPADLLDLFSYCSPTSRQIFGVV